MSAIDLSVFLTKRAGELNLSITAICKMSGVSRSTWHRLINADVKQARVETLCRLSNVLQVDQRKLLSLHSKKSNGITFPFTKSQDAYSFIRDINYPLNTMVKQEEVFEKSWEIVNLGNICWRNRRLICVDNTLNAQLKKRDCEVDPNRNNGRLNILQESIEIPPTPSGENVKLSVKFQAPKGAGTVISFWKIVDMEGRYCFPENMPLSCQVRVTENKLI